MPLELQAALWGGVAGLALLFGAALGYFLNVSQRFSAEVMAFGVGVLVACLSFNLMTEALHLGGVWASVLGFLLGAILFSGANALLTHKSAKHRKNSKKNSDKNVNKAAATASLSIALGALIDGIPESGAIGTSLLGGHGVALVTVIAVFISNVPEGLSSTVGLKRSGYSAKFIFSLWTGITLACISSAWLGYSLIGSLGDEWVAVAVACAAGAIFVMIVDTMTPEAFEELHALSGPIAAAGFMLTFLATQLL